MKASFSFVNCRTFNFLHIYKYVTRINNVTNCWGITRLVNTICIINYLLNVVMNVTISFSEMFPGIVLIEEERWVNRGGWHRRWFTRVYIFIIIERSDWLLRNIFYVVIEFSVKILLHERIYFVPQMLITSAKWEQFYLYVRSFTLKRVKAGYVLHSRSGLLRVLQTQYVTSWQTDSLFYQKLLHSFLGGSVSFAGYLL